MPSTVRRLRSNNSALQQPVIMKSSPQRDEETIFRDKVTTEQAGSSSSRPKRSQPRKTYYESDEEDEPTTKHRKHNEPNTIYASDSDDDESNSYLSDICYQENDEEPPQSYYMDESSGDETESEEVSTFVDNQGVECARIPFEQPEIVKGSLDDIEDVPPNKATFNATQYRDKKLLAIDVGSSFAKAMRIIIPKHKKSKNKRTRCHSAILLFNGKKEYFPSLINYKDGKFCVGEVKDEDGWQTIENIKKIFMVGEMIEITLGKNKFRVSELFSELIKGLLINLANLKVENDKKELQKTIGNYSGFIFTCPTGTSESTKLVYRNCVLKALADLFPNATRVSLNDIYIVEEFSLLKYYCDPQGLECLTMYLDIGHLTADVSVLKLFNSEIDSDDGEEEAQKENDDLSMQDADQESAQEQYDSCEGEVKVIYKNGEVGGMSIIHDIIKKHGLDPLEAMKDLFDHHQQDDKLSESLQSIEKDIIEGLKVITKPICLMILETGIEKLEVVGAITSITWFANQFQQLLSKERIEQLKEELMANLKPEFMAKKVTEFEYSCNVTGTSALLDGAYNLVIQSFKSENDLPLMFEEELDEDAPTQKGNQDMVWSQLQNSLCGDSCQH